MTWLFCKLVFGPQEDSQSVESWIGAALFLGLLIYLSLMLRKILTKINNKKF